MTYLHDQRRQAAAWKSHVAMLPAPARALAPYVNKDGKGDGPAYDFCLPAAYARHNLNPDVREPALRLFDELGIPWHASVCGGPSNHLLSSQVQCVNALAAMVTDPGRILAAFGDLLGIREVLPIEPG